MGRPWKPGLKGADAPAGPFDSQGRAGWMESVCLHAGQRGRRDAGRSGADYDPRRSRLTTGYARAGDGGGYGVRDGPVDRRIVDGGASCRNGKTGGELLRVVRRAVVVECDGGRRDERRLGANWSIFCGFYGVNRGATGDCRADKDCERDTAQRNKSQETDIYVSIRSLERSHAKFPFLADSVELKPRGCGEVSALVEVLARSVLRRGGS
jgi:hypothetical protein